jgi:diguanylate cyclase (GGDEF)-like protein
MTRILFTDPRPSTVVVPPRLHLCAQLSIPALMAAWILARGHSFLHPLAALVGVALLLALVAALGLAGNAAARRSSRTSVIAVMAAAAMLLVGINRGMDTPLGALFLLAVVSATLSPASRELDIGVGAALGALVAAVTGDSEIVSALGFALAALVLAVVVRGLERLLARAREEADLDPLTGMLNRAAFGREATRCLLGACEQESWSVVMIDLDGFGALNKRHGHLAGDRLLGVAASSFKQTVGPGGLVGRLGGDEFAALVPGGCAEQIARRVLARLTEGPEPISASVGVAAPHFEHCDWVTIVREADVALRVAKREGKRQVVVFAEGIEAEEHSNRRRVREVIDRQMIEVVVQPIVDLISGEAHAYEALARFSGAGPSSPAHWFSLAEPLGMRVELELVCLERSLRLIDDLPDAASLSVNLSALAVHDPRAKNMLLSSCPDRLIVELTEEGLVSDLHSLRVALDPLLSGGIKLAVDDMGAGYSNLRQVIALAPSLLKLDRTLIHGIDRDPAQTVLVDALTGYAQRTGAQIVAEGVETEAELEVLRALGIAYGQGYLLGRPAPPWPQLRLQPTMSVHAGGVARGSRPMTVAAEVTADEARKRFVVLPELESLVIVDGEQRPVALLTRNRLLAALGHRFGYALWGDKPVMKIADTRCLRLAADTPTSEIARRSLARPLEHRHDPVLLVDERGRLTGQMTMGDMLFTGYLDRGEASREPALEAVRASATA